MRIAYISTILSYPWGGADTLWTRAAEASSERGDELLICVSDAVANHARVIKLASAGAKIVIQYPPAVPRSLSARIGRKLGLARSLESDLLNALKAFRPERVIFSQGGTYDLVLYPKLAEWLCVSKIDFQLIANWQEERPQLDQKNLNFIRKIFLSAQFVNFVSNRNLAVTRQHLDLPLTNARVIQNPLRWTAADLSPWPTSDTIRIATISRLDESKGIQILLRALAEIESTLPDWRLNIYGKGPYEAALRALTHELGLEHHVKFCGYVKELRAIWAENHLMVSPALEDGVPMTIPEAMLCQRPVLATRVGGAEDWISQDKTGFLSPPVSVDQLALNLAHAFQNQERWRAMGLAAASSASKRYQSDDFLQLIN